MSDDFWKEAYKGLWPAASKREEALAQFIQSTTGYEAKLNGLGAGTDEFLHGSAAHNGYEKGDADFQVTDTNIFLEITGPLSDKVGANQPLWFRPDKIVNARNNILKNHDTFLVHNCPMGNVWRVIHIDSNFLNRIDAGIYPIVHKYIRGNRETYYEIPANDDCIFDISFLIEYIKNYGKSQSRSCPLCGAELVIRTAQRGSRAGKQFWGCSIFPNCGYIENID